MFPITQMNSNLTRATSLNSQARHFRKILLSISILFNYFYERELNEQVGHLLGNQLVSTSQGRSLVHWRPLRISRYD